MSHDEQPQWMTERIRQLEADGVLVKHPPGWQPPPIRIEDFAE